MTEQFDSPFHITPEMPFFLRDLKRLDRVLRGNIKQTFFFLNDLDKELQSLGPNQIPTLNVSSPVFPNSSDNSCEMCPYNWLIQLSPIPDRLH